MARGLLNFAYGYDYHLTPQTPGTPPQAMGKPIQGIPGQTTTSLRELQAFPNPAKDVVVFEYRLKEEIAGNAFIRITNMDGREITRIDLSGQMGTVKWKTGTLENGIYLYQLVFDDKKSEIGKIVLIK